MAEKGCIAKKRNRYSSITLPDLISIDNSVSETDGLKRLPDTTYNEDNPLHFDQKIVGLPTRWGAWKEQHFTGNMTLSEEQELETFPFDVQTFTIKILCTKPEQNLLPFPGRLHSESYFYEHYTPTLVFDSKTSDVEWTWNNVLVESHCGKHVAYVHIKAKRKFNNQMKGLFMFTFCFYLLGLSVFAMVKAICFMFERDACKSTLPAFSQDVKEDLGDRLAYCITFLLTCNMPFYFLSVQIQNANKKNKTSRIFDPIRYGDPSEYLLSYDRRPLYVWMLHLFGSYYYLDIYRWQIRMYSSGNGRYGILFILIFLFRYPIMVYF